MSNQSMSAMTPQIEPLVSSVPLQHPMFTKTLLTVPSGTVVPGNPAFKLTSDVIATIDRTADGTVIASPMLDEEGYGETYEAAWQDFLASLRDRFFSLEKREATLSPPDRAVLHTLRGLLAKSDL